ncbi:enoyl-CoA hydratase/isomerase family protein [Rhodococcus sp. 14C212]|uniref:enoyl-CoA hydratase-related protein n=1 Tax=Rhodococcus sp. 14C212 TaxID=2711209 RepID=UPI00197F0B6E
MSTAHTTRTERNGVLTVRLNRPEKRNAISPDITDALWQAARDLAERDDLAVLVIAADGPYFTAGIDLGAVPADRSSGALASDQDYRRAYRRHHLLYDEFETIEKPIVLAAQGICLGAGLEMACSCDFRLASTEAAFELPEIKLAVLAGSGGTSRLTRLVGPHWAKWIAMAGQRVDAEQALTMGLVHKVVEPALFQETVQSFAEELAGLPREALGLAKLVVDLAVDLDRTGQRHVDRIANSALDGHEEFLQRTARFRSRG